jgi:hypothetical protein
MDKTQENTMKSGINTKLPTCDDKGVFTDDDDSYRFDWFVSKPWFCKRFHIELSLIIKWLCQMTWSLNQIIDPIISVVCLIIKGIDNHDQLQTQ